MAIWRPAGLIQLVLKFHPGLGANPVVPAVAIALAESGGNTLAISPSHDYGLWQINAIHFGDGIITQTNWSQEAIQVAEMWSLSGGGHNWAAWCTAFAYDPQHRCGHGYLAYPEPGSPAGDHITEVQNLWNQRAGTPPPGQAPPPTPPGQQLTGTALSEWNFMRSYAAQGWAGQLLALNNINTAMERIQ